MPADPSKRLHPQAYDALAEGLATFQWYKPPFSQMMTSLFAGDTSVLAGIDLQGRTKREVAREWSPDCSVTSGATRASR